MVKRKIVVGSRESRLAVIQTNIIIDLIKKNNPEIEVELITMKTTGDKILNKTLDKIGGKGLFVKELDKALLDEKVDITIHSLKDMPMEISEDIPIVGYSKREDPRDVLILPLGKKDLEKDEPIGTSSFRRSLMIEKLYSEVKTDWIRGNLQTRLQKLDGGMFSGIVLAAAGIKRLGLEERISRYFSIDEMIPAAGQGVLAIQGRKGEDYSFLENINDKSSEIISLCERSFVRTLDGGCSSPVAAYGEVIGNEIKLKGLYYNEESKNYIVKEAIGDIKEAETLGEKLALKLKREG